jgi:AbrB family looped-hinge helix DNA binding protein
VLAAKGVPLDPEGTKDGRGREPTYRVSVHKNGQIVIGATYTQAMGLKPGDEFEIKLGYKHIHLKQMDGDGSRRLEEEEESFEEEQPRGLCIEDGLKFLHPQHNATACRFSSLAALCQRRILI